MKLRLDENSLRLRLSEAEVAQFAAEGRISVAVPLAPGSDGQLIYALQQTDDDTTAAAPALRVAYTPGRLSVLVPATLAAAWLHPDEVSLEATLEVEHGQHLRLLVEKDTGCRH